ncbi:hypothetical protein HZP44_14925 [Elizabethkingia anophelis]|nr:hypothetical protein [Elizabethkingia anophelis]MCT4209652.1 hypothetical protein [Elizabethkingia anophelis]
MEQKLQEEQNNLKEYQRPILDILLIEMEEGIAAGSARVQFTTTDFEDAAVQGQWDTDSGDRGIEWN